jgi:hypothetical protein
MEILIMTVPNPAYAAQLAERAAELLPDVGEAERLELLGVMDEGDLRSSLAFILSLYPQAFDHGLVRDQAMTERLLDRVNEANQEADVLEPYCSACDGTIGIFRGRGDGWHHFRGAGTIASPVKLFDAGHEPVVAWRENAAGTAQ